MVLSAVSIILIVHPFSTLRGEEIIRWGSSLRDAQSLLYGGATIGALIVLARIAVLGRRRGLRKPGRVLAWFVGFQALANAVFLPFSWVATIGTFVLGFTALVEYRNLLSSAITASVTRARVQPPLQNGPAA